MSPEGRIIKNVQGIGQAVGRRIAKMENKDPSITNPAHYNIGSIEVIDFCFDQKLDFPEAQALQYICRARYKGQELKDLRKAVFFLLSKIEYLERLEDHSSQPTGIYHSDAHEETPEIEDERSKLFRNMKAKDTNLPDPTNAMFEDPTYYIIRRVIGTWDICIPELYKGYSKATGGHARLILDALNREWSKTETEAKEKTQ